MDAGPVTPAAPSSSALTAASDEFDVESGWVAFRTELFDAFDQLGLESVGGDHEIRGSLSHVFEEPGGKMVQVGAVADVYSPPGGPAEVGTVIIAGTEAVLIDRGSGSGPWFRCRGVGISIESADSEYAIVTARSLVEILGC